MDPVAIVQGLRNTFKSGRTRPIEWRQQQLKAVKRMVRANEKAFCDALNKDLGKPHFETMIAEVRGVFFHLLFQNDLHGYCNRVSQLTEVMGPASLDRFRVPLNAF
jgi:hypothetical protein